MTPHEVEKTQLRSRMIGGIRADDAGSTERLGVSGRSRHHHVSRHILRTDVEVLANRTHSGMVSDLGKVIVTVIPTVKPRQHVVRIVTVVFVGVSTDQRGSIHQLGSFGQ